ncbi:type I pullulanase [Neobacillus sp. YIM B02564]|jgi:pullulanase|uniref:Type I pullulanase n=1 Tax=Neobacillus paridis TaxID=2803862 RepID=A0ABS1TMU5_9BACI|nr:type I pullulanase [Neobacillus paridis]MBL4951913.1 type I pullulanase [Neobacillus paridis]
MTSNNRNFLAYLDEMDLITILLPLSYHQGLSSSFSLTDGLGESRLQTIKKYFIEGYYKYICRFSEEYDFGKQYWIIDEHSGKTDLQIGAVIRTEAFDQKFYYEGHDLGVTYQKDQCLFKLWAPTAVQVKLKLNPPSSPDSEIVKLKRGDKGIWSVIVSRDLEYYQYSYLVQVNQEWREAVDPYVKAVSANGEAGVIVNLKKTDRPKITLPPIESPVDAIIYETHIRDFTIHPNSGVKHKGLYLGAGELNTKGKDAEPTGLSYVKALGVTHIEFLPFHDFAGVDELKPKESYNWGYNPLHFNTPEGSYSTDPTDPYSRIIELKQLIDQVHRAGLRVMMDVVYNHVYIREQSSFEKIIPGYYFRHNDMGMPSNGTGVGNDIASERRMVRKFIVDSVRYWLEEYHIDGFRFDLMGILDIETMNEVKTVCDSISKGGEVLIIGEGWSLNTPLPCNQKANLANQDKLPRIAQFNDQFRDVIKGSTFHLDDKGYALGNEAYHEAAFEAITGSIGFNKRENRLFNEPTQTVNYIECHDNHTLWDKLQVCLKDENIEVKKKYHRLATGLVILSQGIPFLHSGQEFFQTKQGNGNSYRAPDTVNQLDWIRKSENEENVNYLTGLIQIRKEYRCFRYRTAAEIRAKIRQFPLPAPMMGLIYYSEGYDILLVVNPSKKQYSISLPKGKWSLLANQHYADKVPKGSFYEGESVIEPISLHVFVTSSSTSNPAAALASLFLQKDDLTKKGKWR